MVAPKGNQYAKGNPNSGRPRIWTDQLIEEEAKYLLEWSKQDDSYVLGECYGARGYSYEHSMEWEKRSQVFSEAKKTAKTIIGARREKLGLLGVLDAGIVKSSMGNYDPEHRAYLKAMKESNMEEVCTAINVLARGVKNE